MEEHLKVEYYFFKNPSYNILLMPGQEDVGELVRETFGLREVTFWREGEDLLEGKGFDREVEEVFFRYSWGDGEEVEGREISMEGFVVFWLKNDQSVRVRYQEYEDAVKEVRGWLKSMYNTARDIWMEMEESVGRDENNRQEREYYNSCRQQYLNKGEKASPPLPTVQFDQIPEPPIDQQIRSSLTEVEPQHTSTFSPRIPTTLPSNIFTDNLAIKKRLKWLFSQYNRKNYKGNSKLTFDQIPNQLSMFSLTVWMMFNRDLGFLKYLKKDEIHGIFKKYSSKQMMSFELFEVALLEVFRRSCKSKEEGWRILMIDTEENYLSRMKEMGVPFLKSGDEQNLYVANTNAPMPQSIFVQKKQPTLKVQKGVSLVKGNHSPSTLKLSKIFSKLQNDFQSPIEFQLQAQDKIFLREYKNTDRKSRHVNSSRLKPYFRPEQSPSVNLLRRLDERVKKYVNT